MLCAWRSSSQRRSCKVIRDGVVIYDGKLASLKRFKDDVKEVTKGNDCGIMIDGFNDYKEYDTIETFKKIQKKATFKWVKKV